MLKKIFGLCLLIINTSAFAAEYYVNPSSDIDPVTNIIAGNDIAECGDITDPCRTVSRLLTEKALAGGDQVNLAAGTYYETVTITNADDGISDTSRVVWQGAGRNLTKWTGLNSAKLNESNCVPNGTYVNVYNCTLPSSITVMGVYETNWIKGHVIVDDRPLNSSPTGTFNDSTGQCNGTCTGHVFEPDYPIGYTSMTSGPAGVNVMKGSYAQSGTALYVRPFRNDVSLTALNLETVVRQDVLIIKTSTEDGIGYITFRDMTFQYAGSLNGGSIITLLNTIGIRFENVLAHSSENSVATITSVDDLVITGSTFASGLRRDNYWRGITSEPTTGNGNGQSWVDELTQYGQGGIVMNLKGPENGGINVTSNVLIEDSIFQDGWGVLGFDGTWNSTFRNVLVKNSPNHNFAPNGSGAGSRYNKFERLIAINGQEGIYHNGCRDCIYDHCAIQPSISSEYYPATGVRIYSSIFIPTAGSAGSGGTGSIDIGSSASTDFYSNYNWFTTNDNRCLWNPHGSRTPCDPEAGTDWTDLCTHSALGRCETRTIYSANISLTNVTLPYSRGLAAGNLTQADFYPVSGSLLIDAGNPDINLDGILETSCSPIRQTDCCDEANHCAGSAPDIGPYEYGIDRITAPVVVVNGLVRATAVRGN